jgi:GDP-L-fucose synthase
MINFNSKIYIAGHNGLVGSAILKKLRLKGYKDVIFRNRNKLDLKDQKKVFQFLKKNKPDFIFIAAAKVGGIYSNNNYKAEYIFDNLAIQSNLIHSAYLCGINNLIFLGSSCVYPRDSKQPIKESYLLSGHLEGTNDAYAIAKIAGIKMCESYNDQYNTNYKCLMPTNTFGPNDNYDKLNSHMFPALIRKAHEIKISHKKEFVLWGNGLAKRELIYVDDLADACLYFMKKNIKETIINIGTGKDYSIKHLAKLVLKTIIPSRHKEIKIKYDLSKPNGTPKKVLDIKRAKKYGWKAKSNLKNSILTTYKDFLKNKRDI